MSDDGDRCIKCGTRVQLGVEADYDVIPDVGLMCHDCVLANRWWNKIHKDTQSVMA